MPDLLRGQVAEPSWFPPDTDEKRQKMGALFEGPANIPKTAKKVPSVVRAIAEQVPGIQKWAVVGFCWGGKVCF